MIDLEYSAMSQEQLLYAVDAKDAEIERLRAENQRFIESGWRSCIDHIIKPNSPCPVCRIEELEKEYWRDHAVWQAALQRNAKLERAREAVQEIAKQNLPDEMEDPDCGDYMGGYEALVLVAREALAACEDKDQSVPVACAFCGDPETAKLPYRKRVAHANHCKDKDND